jgi:hypothetical protein
VPGSLISGQGACVTKNTPNSASLRLGVALVFRAQKRVPGFGGSGFFRKNFFSRPAMRLRRRVPAKDIVFVRRTRRCL